LETIQIVGGTPLRGDVRVSGTKNGSLALLAASLLVPGESVIENLPDVSDVGTMIQILRSLGAKCDMVGPRTLRVNAARLSTCEAPEDLVRKMRASFHVAGPLLARLGEARVPRPGGCVIGSRPINYHLQGFGALGAEVSEEHGLVVMRASRLRGGRMFLHPRFRSVGATLNIMMAATLAEGTTVIENASRDPDVVDCARFLVACGAKISGIGGAAMKITGVPRLHGARFAASPDRMEAGTLLLAGAITQGDVTVRGVRVADLLLTLDALRSAASKIQTGRGWIRIQSEGRPKHFDVITAPFPGFPTDLHPLTVVLMSLAQGRSVMEETIFEARFNYVDELSRMGAQIQLKGNTAIVTGVPRLSGASVIAVDLRAGAALGLAGLAAEGETTVGGWEHVRRGYEDLDLKLRSLGAQLTESERPTARLRNVQSG